MEQGAFAIIPPCLSINTRTAAYYSNIEILNSDYARTCDTVCETINSSPPPHARWYVQYGTVKSTEKSFSDWVNV